VRDVVGLVAVAARVAVRALAEAASGAAVADVQVEHAADEVLLLACNRAVAEVAGEEDRLRQLDVAEG